MPVINLTDRFLNAAKPSPTGRVEYFDAIVKGLAIRVAIGGKRTWYYHFQSPKDGKRARMVLGSYPATSLATARGYAIEHRSHVEEGIDPRDLALADTAQMTVGDLAESFIARHVSKLRSGVKVERRLRKNVLPFIGSMRLADLHRRDIARAIDKVAERGAEVEAGRVFEDVRGMLRWAVSRGDLDHSPAEGMKRPGVRPPRERCLSDEEVATLWQSLPAMLPRSPAIQRIVRLLLVTAQRVGEVAGMRRDELDLGERVWKLSSDRTKNAFAHVVPLSEAAVRILDEAIAEVEDSPFVFPSEQGALPPIRVTKAVARQCQKTVAGWTPHDLRRTALTGMAKLGVAPIVLGHVANHRTTTKSGITLGVYVQHAYEQEKREALDLWADRLAAIVEGTSAEVSQMRKRRA